MVLGSTLKNTLKTNVRGKKQKIKIIDSTINNKLNKAAYAAILLLIIAIAGCIQPLYLYSKAMLAQHLLHQTWKNVKTQHAKTLQPEQLTVLPPWPWADTYPVAKLSLQLNSLHNAAPELHTSKSALSTGETTMHSTIQTKKNVLSLDKPMKITSEISWIILAGMTGRTMAFGPGWLQDSAKPNKHGNTVISAHNDSHFSILENVNIGDTFILEDQSSGKEQYQITTMGIVNEHDNTAYEYSEQKMLTLITCYPFTLNPGNKSKRLVITAIAT